MAEFDVSSSPGAAINENSLSSVIAGNYSKSILASAYHITGADVLGHPTSGYVYHPEATPFYTFLDNGSGWNEGLDSNRGRTAAVAYRTKIYQEGQGDAVAYNASVFVTGARSGSTSFLANPAGTVVNGDLTAGADGVYLNAGEFMLNDHGFDAAGIGWVVNLRRTNGGGNKDAWWAGFRAQSIGTEPVDAAFSAAGKFRTGLDLTSTDASLAGIALKAGQRIYFSASRQRGFSATRQGEQWIGASGADTPIAISSPAGIAVGASGDRAGLIAAGLSEPGAAVTISGASRTKAASIGTTAGPLLLDPKGGALILPHADVDPEVSTDGAIYFNSRMKKLRLYVSGSWISLN